MAKLRLNKDGIVEHSPPDYVKVNKQEDNKVIVHETNIDLEAVEKIEARLQKASSVALDNVVRLFEDRLTEQAILIQKMQTKISKLENDIEKLNDASTVKTESQRSNNSGRSKNYNKTNSSSRRNKF